MFLFCLLGMLLEIIVTNQNFPKRKIKRKIYKGYLLTYFMKTLNETFEDSEYKLMKKLKNGLSWHDFIILLVIHAQDSIKKGNLKIINKKDERRL